MLVNVTHGMAPMRSETFGPAAPLVPAGIEGLDVFRQPKHVHLDYRIERNPYWYPYDGRLPG